MNRHSQQHFEANSRPIFDCRTANEWLAEAAAMPEPKRLLGGLWREGEMAVLFGPQGSGKSVLATQIADTVSRGQGFGPFETEADGQKVVYLDLKLTPKQFAMRYKGEQPGECHRFDENLRRVHVNLDAELPDGCRSLIDHLIGATRELIRETGAKVLIVDNISQLMRSNDVVRDVLPLMRELNRLKRVDGVSVLVIAQSKKVFRSRRISIDDLQSVRMLGSLADTIFAIGDGGRGGAERYVKHLKSRSGEVLYDHNLVPRFRVETAGDMLGFVYERCVTEQAMYGDHRDDRDWATIDRIKQMYDEDKTIRDIAAELGMSKTTVHRMLQMWEPMPEPAFDEGVPEINEHNFPGREEYTEALADPRFNEMFESEDPYSVRMRREYGLILKARADAWRTYLATGVAPTLAESLSSGAPEITAGIAGNSSVESADGPRNEGADQPGGEAAPMTVVERFLAKRKHALNGYGRDIWVEEEDFRGKPIVWYGYNPSKTLQRYHRTCGYIQVTRFEVASEQDGEASDLL